CGTRPRAAGSGGGRLSQDSGLPQWGGALREGGLKTGGSRNGDPRNGLLFARRLPSADPPRAVRGASESRRPRRIGPRQRDDLAAGVLAERRHEDRSSVITSDDANSDHRRVSGARRSGPASQARLGTTIGAMALN